MNNYLDKLFIVLKKYLDVLWEEPIVVAQILLNADIKDVKENLAHFICNNFYQNILSPYSVEQKLLYVITFMLREEINKINSVNQLNDFLENSSCGYLLGELGNKNDIKEYAKNVIINIIEKIETTCSEKELTLNIINLENDIKKIEKDFQNDKYMKSIEDNICGLKIDKSLDLELKDGKFNEIKNKFEIYKIKYNQKIILFNNKYITNLTEKELSQIITKYDNQQNMKDYLSKYIHKSNIDKQLLSNEKLISNIFNSKYSNILLFLYQIDFLKLIELMDLLIESFINNIQILPKPLKYICKIISLLIQNKFPKATKLEQNAFICKFLFVNLLIPILKKPYSIYINNFIICQNTLNNLNYLLDIFQQLVLGNLYINKENEFYFTPFNWYFIERMPEVFELYEKIIRIKLPTFIEKFIKNQLPTDYKYDYFKENPEQIINHKSIIFSLNDISCLINNMEKCKYILFPGLDNNDKKLNKKNNIEKLYIIFKKLNAKEYKDYLKSIQKKEEIDNKTPDLNTEKKIMSFHDLLINHKYKDLFNIEQGIRYFNIKELKQINNDEDIKNNNIIKTKNYISGLLYNCRQLDDSDSCLNKNTLDILKEFKVFLKSSDFVIDNTLPYEWYIYSLLDCLKKIPKELAENDYELLYNELENDIKKAIEIFDLHIMSNCFEKTKYAKKAIDYYTKAKNYLSDIVLILKLKKIIEKTKMPIKIYINIKDIKLELINNSNNVNNIGDLNMRENDRNKRICLNINEFINYFPSFLKLDLKYDIKLLELMNNLNIPKTINNYINFALNTIKKKYKFQEEEFKLISEKINDFIFNKLYDKLYPAYPDDNDIQILKNCYKLSWTQSKNFIESKNDNENNNYDIFLDDIKQLFTELELEKSPRKKLLIIDSIFTFINKIFMFVGDNIKEVGADKIVPILTYLFVRVQPKKIFTDINYIKIFMTDIKNIDISHLTILDSVCNLIKNINYNNLNGVTEQEFNQKCQMSLIVNKTS